MIKRSGGQVIRCDRCGKQKRVFSSAAYHANVCDACLPDNPNPQLQRLLARLKGK